MRPKQYKQLLSCFFPLHQLLQQRTASLTEAQRSAQSAQVERATVEERLRGLQRAVAMLETEKKDAERQAVRLEKDKNALRNTLDKVRDTLINNLQPKQNNSYNYLLAKAQLQETNRKVGFMCHKWCVGTII